MRKWLFVIVTALIMPVVSVILVKIIDGTVQIDNDCLLLGVLLAVVNLLIGFVSYRIYIRQIKE